MSSAPVALSVGATGLSGSISAQLLISQGRTTYGLSRTPATHIWGLRPVMAELLDPAALSQALAVCVARGTPTLTLPQGWRALFPPDEVQLAPGEESAVLISVSAPATAPAGAYVVKLDGQGVQASASVHIAQRRALNVTAVPDGAPVLDGQAAVEFLVRNDGNAQEELTLTADPPALKAPSSLLTLAPGEQKLVRVAGSLPLTAVCRAGSPSRSVARPA